MRLEAGVFLRLALVVEVADQRLFLPTPPIHMP